MREQLVTASEKVFCDKCWVQVLDTKTAISFEIIDEVGLRVIERPAESNLKQNRLARHLQGRSQKDFCSRECCRNYLHENLEHFMAEITPKPIKPKTLLSEG